MSEPGHGRREGKNLMGRVIAIVFGIFGKRTLEKAYGKTIRRWKPGTRSGPSFRRRDPDQASDGVPGGRHYHCHLEGDLTALEQYAGRSVRTAW
ncbi:MAG TPA: hypothetical protein VFP66_06705 [Candidatus Limnocylindrales bacterium]|nr:hypothetical protein [Candidatus Limnocylindrales bacterium]